MEATVGPAPAHGRERSADARGLVYRHSVATRLTHWLGALALLVLVMSGLQIFNAAPYLDASDKSDPAHRVLWIQSEQSASGSQAGVTSIFGHSLKTTHVLGYTSDGQGAEAPRAFPGWLTFPGYQDLASGRRWHLFFAWIMVLCGAAYLVAGAVRKDLGLIVLRPADLPKMLPMQLYYFGLRKEPPEHGKYNPLQKAGYTFVLFVLSPFLVITGLALSPGIDAFAGPLTGLLGGRQFARTWHFLAMLALIGFVFGHVFLVVATGFFNNMRSMVAGTYRLGPHEGTGP
ncbi:MAG: cytochrome b/b6 domain-containing protein [Candidatus Eremiobacteraeota bacterium]|nr:cytochrome b/b6 domain-containing protein [Candidatus Eremiobacteraeota bacterium]